MKKFTVFCLTVGLILGGGIQTFAMEEEITSKNVMNFGQMIKKHENMSVRKVKDMYLEHHGTLGSSESVNFKMYKDCME